MKPLKLIIVSINIKESPQAMPLAAGLLKSALISMAKLGHRLTVDIKEFTTDNSVEEISSYSIEEKPHIIGFSTYLWNRKLVEDSCRSIKDKNSEILIFSGGAEPTAMAEDLLLKAPFDFVIKGEGELVLAEIMNKILQKEDYNNIAGIFTRDRKCNSEDQQPVMDLDSIPSPFLTGILDSKKYRGILWELSRGCPFKCKFCFESRGISEVRQFSLERIREELKLFEKNGVSQIFVLDPTFNRDVKRAKKILRMIESIAPEIHYTFEVRTEFLDDEMAELFSRLNCSLQIGLQSANPEVLSNLNRKIDTQKYFDKVSLLNSHGVIFGLDLIYGLPGDYLEGFKHSLDYALTLQPNHLDIFPLAVLPGTALYDEARSFQLNYMKEAPYGLMSSPGFSTDDMKKAGEIKEACDIFYNQGGAAGWLFMVTETLEINPSDFLEEFSIYIKSNGIESHLSREDIKNLQIAFVKSKFKKSKMLRLFPPMKDIILINSAFNLSLYAGSCESVNREDLQIIDKARFKISPATVFLNLKYNYNDLMAVGEYNLDEFISFAKPDNSNLLVYNNLGAVKPLVLEDNYFKLFSSFKDVFSFKDLVEENTSLTRDELLEFIQFAIDEKIFYLS